jgi:hypothetical protein
VRTARNVAIIMLLALAAAFAPNGGNVVDALFVAIGLAFLSGISWMLYVLSRENQLTLATLRDSQRWIFYGGFALIVLLIAGAAKMFDSGGGTVLWIVLLAAAVAGIWRVWSDANSYG